MGENFFHILQGCIVKIKARYKYFKVGTIKDKLNFSLVLETAQCKKICLFGCISTEIFLHFHLPYLCKLISSEIASCFLILNVFYFEL